MNLKRTYSIAVGFCGGLELLINSAAGLIIIMLSLIYWEVISD